MMVTDSSPSVAVVRSPARVAALRRLELLDTPPEEAFDRLTRLAARLLRVPIALVTLIDEDRQVLKSCVGLSEQWTSVRQTPLGYSLCQYAIAASEPLVVADAREDPQFRDSLAVATLGCVAYAGIPLVTSDGHALGALCAIDRVPRQWSEDDIETLRDLAAAAITQIELRASTLEANTLASRLEQERATLQAITASISDGLVLLDASGRVRYSNGRASALLGYASHSLDGLSVVEIFQRLSPDLENPEKTWSNWQRAIRDLATRPTLELVFAGPPPRNVQANLFPIDSRGDGSFGVLIRDVTAETEVNRARSELVFMVTHDLRSPLASILGFAELLLDYDCTEQDQRQYLETILNEAQRLTSLVNDFMDLQRMESGRLQIRPRPIDLRALLQQAVAALVEDVRHPTVMHAPDELPQVMADPPRILQVVTNLLANARKYSPMGGEVRLSARQVDRAIEVTVQDTGLGIATDALPRIFDRFYRVAGDDRRRIQGTGLGLAIAREIVESHGGRIGVRSDGPGTGSTFWFTLPTSS